MRRALLIAVPVTVILTALALMGKWYADLHDPLRPMKHAIAHQSTYFFPNRPGSPSATVQDWVWLKPEAKKSMGGFMSWLEAEGWTVRGEASRFEALRTDGKPTSILPSEDIRVSPEDDGETLVVYVRQVSGFQAFLYQFRYENIGFNDPQPRRPD